MVTHLSVIICIGQLQICHFSCHALLQYFIDLLFCMCQNNILFSNNNCNSKYCISRFANKLLDLYISRQRNEMIMKSIFLVDDIGNLAYVSISYNWFLVVYKRSMSMKPSIFCIKSETCRS